MDKVDTIPCRRRVRKGREQLFPERPPHFGLGDRYEYTRLNGRINLVIYRASRWQRLKIRAKEKFGLAVG